MPKYLFQASYQPEGPKGLIEDNVTAAALSLAINATEMIGVKTTVLLSVKEMDQAMKKQVAPGH